MREPLTPFWAALAARGVSLGLLDVPFARSIGVQQGFEVSDWGPHDVVSGQMSAHPAAAAALVDTITPHPFRGGPRGWIELEDRRGLAHAAEAASTGIGARGELATKLLSQLEPELAIINFPEIHQAGHVLWHTVVPEHQLFQAPGAPDTLPRSTVPDLLCAFDQQIARLTALVGPEASVVVLSPCGMRPGWGVPMVLPALLQADGLARPPDSSDSWRQRAVAAMTAVKRKSPPWARRLYQRVPRSVRTTLAEPTILDPHDWARTRVFALPTDHIGWLRVNLAGRERLGIVAEEEYGALCDTLEHRLERVKTVDGRSVVAELTRTTPDVEEARTSRLPDLAVQWDVAAYEDPLDVDGGVPPSTPFGRWRTGQHSSEGFCLATGRVADALTDTVAIEALPSLLVAALGETGL